MNISRSLRQEMKAIKEKEDEDVVIVSDPAVAMSTSHEAFLRKLKQQTSGGLSIGNGSSIPGRTLERAMSSPLVTAGHHMPSLIPHEESREKTFMTGTCGTRGRVRLLVLYLTRRAARKHS